MVKLDAIMATVSGSAVGFDGRSWLMFLAPAYECLSVAELSIHNSQCKTGASDGEASIIRENLNVI